ncbi:hypothetical protein ABT263_10700 [Kitasatospora sp. NPDC001603]|uniref:hypothetical protein n=1 Tax=Kitasatospora sp. NPDC001603 TaxID=3154388 RepID=UPI0033232A37
MTSTPSHPTTAPHPRPAAGLGDAGAAWARPVGLLGSAGRLGLLGPWSVRGVPASRGRAALEVYEHGELVDVVVAARLAPELLRGARRCPALGARESYGLVWGRLPQGGPAPAVGFTAGRLRRAGRRARVVEAPEVVTVAGEFWLAWARGPFDGVLVEHPAGRVRRSLERVRPRGRSAR